MTRALVAMLVLAASAVVLTQQRDSRSASGTGAITGTLWSADATPQPIRRALVTISDNASPSRSVVTDDAGKFVFEGLPTGTFTITARKAAYLTASHGATRPGRPGSAISLTAGQRVDVTVTMFRGAAIAGVLRDAAGLPLPGIQVSAADMRSEPTALDPLGSGLPNSAVTDDQGVYRIYGLPPGEYIVWATPSLFGSGEIGARADSETDSALSTLAQRRSGVVASSPPTARPTGPAPTIVAPAAPVGFAPTYFPGTPFYGEAARLRLAVGETREGVSFVVDRVRVSSIEGTVAGDVPNLAAVQLSLIIDGPRVGGVFNMLGIVTSPPDAQGQFKYSNVPPGRYRIVARGRRGGEAPPLPMPRVVNGQTVGSGQGPSHSSGEHVFAVADLEVRGQDVNGIALALQSAAELWGTIVFDSASTPMPATLTGIRIGMQLIGGSYSSSSGGTVVGNSLTVISPIAVSADGTFKVAGLGPSAYSFTVVLPPDLSRVWRLRSAIVDGRDLLDGPIEPVPGVNITGVRVTLSDKRTQLSGILQTASGQPTADYYVLAFSSDRNHWRTGSRRLLSTRPATDGRFVFDDLPAGEYFIAALTDLDPLEWKDAAFLEQVAPAAVKVSVAEGEKKVQDLRIR